MPTICWRLINHTPSTPPRGASRKGTTLRQVLHDASGYACSGNGPEGGLVAIMGASGSGKSTLLSFLSGRADPDSGTRMLNGHPFDKHTSRSIGFVPQVDKLFSALSVLETLQLHATLRGVGSHDFDQLLRTLDLTATAHTLIGEQGRTSGRLKGISGGERKRVAMALELLHSPPLLILDEPLSGLDSAAAAHVSAVLAKLAVGSQAVLITLHQPSARDYAKVAHLGLLSPHGETVFFGPAPEAVGHFSSPSGWNAPLPAHTVPAEHFLDVMAAASSAAARSDNLEGNSARRYLSCDIMSKLENGTADRRPGGAPEAPGVSLLLQAAALFSRTNRDNLRNPAHLHAMLMRSLTMALIVGHLYAGLGNNQGSVQDRVGALYFVMTNQIMSSTGSLRTFIVEREIARHEIRSGLYRLPAYFAARSVAESVWQCVMALLFAGLTYTLVGFAPSVGQLGFFLVTVALVTLCAESYAVLVGSCLEDRSAAVAGPVVLALFMVSGGLFVNAASVPPFFALLNRINVFSYGFSALLQNEMAGLEFGCRPDELVGPPPPSTVAQKMLAAALGSAWPKQVCPVQRGEQVVERMAMDALSPWENVAMLLALMAGFRLLAFMVLRRRFL